MGFLDVIPENFAVAKFIRDPVKPKVSRLLASIKMDPRFRGDDEEMEQ
jgi:hypothetical protein